MNKVIARLKQLAAPLKQWGDVLDIFLNYSFDEYKGIAIMALGNKYTISVAPAGKARGVSASASNLRIGLHEGKVATDKTLIDSAPVKVGEFNAKTLANGLRGWLTQDHGISSSLATSFTKEFGEIYQDILNGGMDAKSPAEYLAKQPKRKPKSKAPVEDNTEIPLEDMRNLEKGVFDAIKPYYKGVKFVKGKLVTLTVDGVDIACSMVGTNACIEFERGDAGGYAVVSVPAPINPTSFASTIQRAFKQVPYNNPDFFRIIVLYLTTLLMEL